MISIYFFDKLNIILVVFIGIIIYVFSLFVLGGFSKEDLDFIKLIIYRRKNGN
jgi:hypothetical protein